MVGVLPQTRRPLRCSVKTLKVAIGVVTLVALCQPIEAFPESSQDEENCPALFSRLAAVGPQQPIPRRLFSPASMRLARYHSSIYKKEIVGVDWESSQLAPGTAPTGRYAEYNNEKFRQLRKQIEELGGKIVLIPNADFFEENGVFIDVVDNTPILVVPPHKESIGIDHLIVCYFVWEGLREELIQHGMPPQEANLTAWSITQTPFGQSYQNHLLVKALLANTNPRNFQNLELLTIGNKPDVDALKEAIVGTWQLEISDLSNALRTQLRDDFQSQIDVLVSDLIHKTLDRRKLLARHYRELAARHPVDANSVLPFLLRALTLSPSSGRRDVILNVASNAEPGVRYHFFAAYFALPSEKLRLEDLVGIRSDLLSEEMSRELSRYLLGYLESHRASAN